MTGPIRHTDDDWSVITTADLPSFFVPRPPGGVLPEAIDEGMPPGYEPPRLMPADRRQHPRREIKGSIQVTLGGRDLAVQGVDVSAGGMACEPVPYWARRGDPILVRLPGTARHILGRVAWVRRRTDLEDDQVIGIRFATPQRGLHVLD